MNTNIFKSIASIMIGAGVSVFLSIGTDGLMRALGVFPLMPPMKDSLFVLATVYRTLFGAIGGYLTARIAPTKPMMHAFVLGATGLVASIAGAIASWNKLPELGPKWYPIVLIVLAVPPALAGGWLRVLQLSGQRETSPDEFSTD
ncbi:MAG: hypothetical protein WAK20_03780 [Candidatus Acidiferrum sp.]